MPEVKGQTRAGPVWAEDVGKKRVGKEPRLVLGESQLLQPKRDVKTNRFAVGVRAEQFGQHGGYFNTI